MFCLNCGAEAPPRGVTCPVCGNDLGRSTADLRSSVGFTSMPLEAGETDLPAPSVKSLLGSPSIRDGDLDRPGLPRDALGRALLIVILALAADLLLPWRVIGSQHQMLPPVDGIAIAVVIMLAALPLFHPRLRQATLSAALPLLSGGVCLGIGAAFWMNLGIAGYTPFSVGILASSSPGFHGSAVAALSPDFGLFGFLLGALLLAVIGYNLFLVAVRTTVAKSIVAAPVRHAPVPVPQPVPAGRITATIDRSAPDVSHSKAPEPASTPEFALPGSDSWNRSLKPPTFLRPQAGSIRRPHR